MAGDLFSNVDPLGNPLGLPDLSPAQSTTEAENNNLSNRSATNILITDTSDQISRRYNLNSSQSKTPNSDDNIVNLGTLPATTVTAKFNSQINYTPLDNPLNVYSTYTYGITLYLLGSDDFNLLSQNASSWLPGNSSQVLISSAGRYNNSMIRNNAFNEDFYFENLKLQTVIGLNSRTQGSNAIDISFSIIEPMGLTLMNRLLDASNTVNSQNYLEMPYLLQIDFFGNTDTGQIMHPIPNISKYIPIKLIEMKIKVGTKGSEYQIRAVPYNHTAFMESKVSTPAHFEVSANTVKSFFENTSTDIIHQKKDKENSQRELQNQNFGVGTDASISRNAAAKQSTKTTDSAYRINSYTGAFNDWNKQLTVNNNTQYPPVQISFVIDDEIAKSSITVPKINSPTRAPMVDIRNPLEVAAQLKSNQGKGNTGPNLSNEIFSINTGTNILSVVNMVIRNSDYIRNQIIDPSVDSADPQTLANKQNKPLNWFKVIPAVKLNQFDKIQNKWSISVTYYIKKFIYYNRKHPYAPQSFPNGYVKDYQFMYTGKNDSIIDFNIDFDTLFYTAISIDRAKMSSLSQSQDADLETNKDKMPVQPAGSAMPKQSTSISGDQQSTASGDAIRDSKTQVAADLMKSIYSSSRGDMINLQLKIIGDPHFIKQDDFYINPGDSSYTESNQLINSGSLAMDTGEIHARVIFKTPIDYDDSTGLLKNSGNYVQSTFSGIYKIITVDNDFRSGMFTQTLNLIRLFDQPDFDVSSSTSFNTTVNDNRSMVPKTPADVELLSTLQSKSSQPSAINIPTPIDTSNMDDPLQNTTVSAGSIIVDTAPQTQADIALQNTGNNSSIVSIDEFNFLSNSNGA